MSEPTAAPSRAAFTVAFVVGVTPGKWARVWSERMPALPLILVPVTQEAAVTALAEGTVDAALLRLPVDNPELSVIPLYSEQPVVVASKGHALEAADTVTLGELAEFAMLNDSNVAQLIELVAANAGIAVVPQSVARALSRRDVTARPVTDAPQTRVALAWPADSTTPAVEEFVGIVRGRTANSSRGVGTEAAAETKPAQNPAQKKCSVPKAPTRPKPKTKRRPGR